MGTNNGMVAIMIAPMVEEIMDRPKASPRKYTKGSKMAKRKNHLKSSLRIFIILPEMSAKTNRNGIEIINRIKTIAMGSRDSLANLKATKDIPQNTITIITLMVTQIFFKLIAVN
jgi:hypothetical protein